MSISIRVDRTLLRAAGQSRRFVLFTLQAPPAPPALERRRLPVSFAFVLDRSGSMARNKLDKAKEAVVHGIRSLHDGDRLAVVVFDDTVELIVPSTRIGPGVREAAVSAVEALTARGGTDLCAGWLRGCEQVGAYLGPNEVGRCLLLTDGQANHGTVDHSEIANLVGAQRERRVSTSTFGLGGDFDERLLGRMADVGGGNFHFIEGAAQIPELVGQEIGEMLAMTARDVVLVVEADPLVTVESLNEFPLHSQGGTWRISLGSLFAGQLIEPVLALRFPSGTIGEHTRVNVRIEDRDGAFGAALEPLSFVWAGHAENDHQKREPEVDRVVARTYASAALRRAHELNREGRFDAARETVSRCITRIRAYAGGDPELLALLQNLEQKQRELSQDMDVMARKRGHYEARSGVKSRSHVDRTAPRITLLPIGPSSELLASAAASLARADADLFGKCSVDESLRHLAIEANQSNQADHGTQAVLSAPDELALVADASRNGQSDVRIVFVTRRLEDNWFSHWHPTARTAVVSLADWAGTFNVSPLAFVAYELVHHGLHALSPTYEPRALTHPETRGCLYDLCGERADIELKLQRAELCPPCVRGLARMGIQVSRVLELASVLRALAATT